MPVYENKKELKNEEVYRALRNMIALRRFEPGFSLNVQKLSKSLGVSRTPMWEAMRKLEQQGVIETIPNRGVFMARASFEQMLEVVAVRGAMDLFAGCLACARIGKRALDRLAACLPVQLAAIESGDVGAYMLSDNKFHGLIYEASRNSYLMELYDSITLRMLPVPVSTEMLIHPPHQPSAYLAHQQVVEALAERDQAGVEAAMMHHTGVITAFLEEKARVEDSRREMVRRMEKQLPLARLMKRRSPLAPAKKA
ncbi:MAG: GntR family transcriptional regulator [Syntrophorhabdales bacterium]|jgi:DNA-binding GntR family transcriptional regulator